MSESSGKSVGVSGTEGQRKLDMRLVSEDKNPCLKEAEISHRCLERNFYVREQCALEYDNYNECKKFWGNIKYQRIIAGIKPVLPTPEERAKIVELKKKGVYVNSVNQ